MNERKIGDALFVQLTALFVAALVVCNLIANKFVTVDLGFRTFVVSAGILPYPLTFLVTDLLSELYGKRAANRVVLAGFVASVFVVGTLWLGSSFAAIPDSKVGDAEFEHVFRNAPRVIAASMIAYLCAQLVDIRLFHFWKGLTRGRHLWLRNNASTVLSQLLDTVLVVGVLFAGDWSVGRMASVVQDGWLFKVLCALLDTPLIYLIVHLDRRARADRDPSEPLAAEAHLEGGGRSQRDADG